MIKITIKFTVSKYEKFIEDCNIRRKRNEIILRSLNRVEDKAKAIFAKTETLKLYKERYVSYLKQNEFLKNSHRNIPTVSQDPSYHEVVSKSVHWKTPNVAEIQEFNANEILKQNDKFHIDTTDLLKKEYLTTNLEEKSKFQKQNDYLYNLRRNGVNHTNFTTELPLQSIHQPQYLNQNLILSNKNSSRDILYNGSQAVDEIKAKKSDEGKEEKQTPVENVNITNVTSLYSNVHNDNKVKEKILKVPDHSHEDISPIENLIKHKEKNEMKEKEKEFLEFNKDFEESDIFDSERKNSDENIESIGEKIYPKGMDGVDFNNETYPDSYYEQPTHTQNYPTNITSNVILEEDEFEEEMDQFEPEPSVHNLNKSNRNSVMEERNYDETKKVLPTESHVVNNSSARQENNENLLKTWKNNDETSNTFTDLRHSIINDISKNDSYDSDSSKTDSNKGYEGVKTKKSENNSNEISNADNNNSIEKIKDLSISTKSNLAHLLESDSESFQIEHGEIISGNEDSDFDFSFNQNP
ncbi:glutamic acid-rich protein precursor, putative [Pediculus humanus corporis]|uniref:Glutamic acid-rich protein, putative n=1 Tax=Pediculus humanus subsp. corporis TaxID=121224 RepID=E0VSJ5_PEDHC|nr:glutamic acid-rich protein precursor, putative [Pediculus humanus corporis]EEB16351.1 glutamic acid-rich protein precursor, putative [Pediculus humanus corporis]